MADMKTTNIKGKEYVMVNERIKAFRSNFKDYRLITRIIDMSEKHCMMVAEIFNPAGEIVANGYARETVDKCPVNKFAYVENCETSAVGRALGMFGIGVDTAICSAEELKTKLSYDEKEVSEQPKQQKVVKQVNELSLDQRYENCKKLFSQKLTEKDLLKYKPNIESLIEDLNNAGMLDKVDDLSALVDLSKLAEL